MRACLHGAAARYANIVLQRASALPLPLIVYRQRCLAGMTAMALAAAGIRLSGCA